MSDQPKRQAPAFQFYADDFIAGTVDMSPAEVGAYIRLLCYQWCRGSAPALPEKMQRVAGGIVSDDVIAKFPLCSDGNRRNARLEKVREASDAYRKIQAQKAGKRWGHDPAGMPGHSTGNAGGYAGGHAEPMPKGMPNACSPSPAPSPNSILPDKPSEDEKPAKSKKERKPVERNAVLDALVESCGGDPLATTRSGWAQAATALRDIKEVQPNVTAEDIKAKASAYRRLHPDWDLTSSALAKHWGSLMERKGDLFDGEDWRKCL
jgi:hypothetical protein